MKIKNILLTGSGGFIGSHIKHFLGEYNLYCPRSYELNLMDSQAVKNYVEDNNINFIIHSASCGVRISENATIEDVAKPNLEMFNNLANLVNENRPMITFGSGAEYDKSRPIINIKEEDFGKSIPKDPYGYSKYMISKEIEKRENILNLRIFGIYGKNEHPTRVTSCIVDAKIKNEPVILNQNVRFHFIWIDDFCKIVKYFIENPTKEKFINVVPTESVEIVELAKLLNVDVIIKKDGFNNEYTGDNTILKQTIPNLEFLNYEDGMKKFLQSYINYIK